MFNRYKCITSSNNVLGSLTPDQFLSKIKSGDEHLEKILKARQVYRTDSSEYNNIKVTQLPCYTLNFTFEGVRNNCSIIASTGHIYIDLDNQREIDLQHPLIYASWMSLSDNGRGILVKVDNVNPENFKDVYSDISKQLGIKADKRACKPTQPNVLSYDPQVYTNQNSLTYKAIDKEEIPHYNTINKEIDTIGTVVGTNFGNIRFDNLDELIENIEFNGDVLYDYRTKVKYASVFIKTSRINRGERNDTICGYAYQLRALNLGIKYQDLYNVLKDINSKYCHPPLPLYKIHSITKGVMNVVDIKPKLNKERRFVYNPDYDLTPTEKRQLNIKVLSKDREKDSKRKIEKTIDDWDFEKEGKITQKGLAKISGKNIKTIQKYYHLFKSHIQILNLEFKNG
ncbi:VirE-like protein [Maribacter spongiicola]|uniref:VirE-like protein n=1 Tax=Maribacter spongiicola TaxID=1206753 RepID=A0A4R7JWY0_9FLAO|nr:BT4734/BF3469 family protein [Maribacter spongiicola]TDT41963.1 VirE-like protein [Maribacter spongiicola]